MTDNQRTHDSNLPALDRLLAVTPLMTAIGEEEKFNKNLDRLSAAYEEIRFGNTSLNTINTSKLLHFLSVIILNSDENTDPSKIAIETIDKLVSMKVSDLELSSSSLLQGGLWAVEISMQIVSYKDKLEETELIKIINILIDSINKMVELIPTEHELEANLTKNSISRDLTTFLSNQLKTKSPQEATDEFVTHVEKCILMTEAILSNFKDGRI